MNLNLNWRIFSHFGIHAPVNSPTTQVVEKNNMKWATPTWFLLHTLAHKVKSESFSIVSAKLSHFLFSICLNLPCPICAKHAESFLSNVLSFNFTNKEQLVSLFFNFHNHVNASKNLPLFPLSELEPKYENAVTINIINHFFQFFNEKQYNVGMITNNMHRERLIRSFKIWLNDNLKYFDP